LVLQLTMGIEENLLLGLQMDSNLTGIVGPCHSLRLGVLQLFFLFLHKPLKFSWWSRFSELTRPPNRCGRPAGAKNRSRHRAEAAETLGRQWAEAGRLGPAAGNRGGHWAGAAERVGGHWAVVGAGETWTKAGIDRERRRRSPLAEIFGI
jgi:hypothetical protein